ncbi:hypothetical protein HanOQP8_Chr02g0041231 [Helianthus annuus]|nr:hypothetical protein HanOQP8_Chr02g0041231 [Helianthus annuus]
MNERIGITLAWTQTRKGTGQEDARKQTRTQTLEVSDYRTHLLIYLNEVRYAYYWES